MKRILVIIALCSPLLMQAQSIEHILKSIEQNNKELKAQKHAADATKMENRTNNNLPDPTVSYFAERSGGQATTGCPPGYSAECEESLSGPYSVESGKDIDGYPYEKCG